MVNVKGDKVQYVNNGEWINKDEYIKKQLDKLLTAHINFNTAGNDSDGLTSVNYNKQITNIENELVNQFGLTWEQMEEIEFKSYNMVS